MFTVVAGCGSVIRLRVCSQVSVACLMVESNS
jgi:hypothetical protein